MANVSLDAARAAKAKALQRLKGIDQVVGVGITRVAGDYAVKVNLREPVDPTNIPSDIDGVPLRVEVVGPIRMR